MTSRPVMQYIFDGMGGPNYFFSWVGGACPPANILWRRPWLRVQWETTCGAYCSYECNATVKSNLQASNRTNRIDPGSLSNIFKNIQQHASNLLGCHGVYQQQMRLNSLVTDLNACMTKTEGHQEALLPDQYAHVLSCTR